jgi:hypothetical protein
MAVERNLLILLCTCQLAERLVVHSPNFRIFSPLAEFLEREVMQGKILDSFGNPSFPPGNKTIWEGHVRDSAAFWHWWRNVTKAPLWDFSSCVVGIASQPGPKGQMEMLSIAKTIPADNRDTIKEFVNNPTNVDADPADRLREMLGTRRDMCIYNDKQQKSKVMVRMMIKIVRKARPFYSYELLTLPLFISKQFLTFALAFHG